MYYNNSFNDSDAASIVFDSYAELEKRLEAHSWQKLINEEMTAYPNLFESVYESCGTPHTETNELLRGASSRPTSSLSLALIQESVETFKKNEETWKRIFDVDPVEDNWVFSTRPSDADSYVVVPEADSDEWGLSRNKVLMTMDTSESSSDGSFIVVDEVEGSMSLEGEESTSDRLTEADSDYFLKGYDPHQLDLIMSSLQLVPASVEMIAPSKEDEIAIRANNFESDEFAGMNLLFARRTVEQLLAERTSTVLPEASHRHDYVHKVVMRLFMIQRFAPAPLPKRENTRSRCCSFCYNFVLTTCRKMGVRAPSKDDFGPWSTHEIVVRQNNEKFTQCQFLRCQVCPHCKMSGTKAHTMSHCPENPNRRRNSLMIDGDGSEDSSTMGGFFKTGSR
ncbi:unnamed protein product [Caenorhabditis bovis]|uniref:Nanos-type domain-containing protein n=1 Tax=Caenorhabditis bovis TaxID=2654633 RepID=A0A8S1EAF4_9PELO|nr:unnamed protein product [Caenorhabditis bovis]